MSGTKPHTLPQFDNAWDGTRVDDLEHRQLESMATSALIIEFRKILQKKAKYSGSKLELMDAYQVKKSSLASSPVYIMRWKLPSLTQVRSKKSRATQEHQHASNAPSSSVAPLRTASIEPSPPPIPPVAHPSHLHGADLRFGVALSRSPRRRHK